MSRTNKATIWYGIVSVLALAWNMLGVMAYIQQATMTTQALQALPVAERAFLESRPAWATAAFAIAVFGGAAGCLLLLLRSRMALPVLVLSFLGVAAQMTHAFLIADGYATFSPGGVVMPIMIVVVSILLIWFARRVRKHGWLR